MLDFSGWFGNWSWDSGGSRELPRALLIASTAIAVAGAAVALTSWRLLGVIASTWLLVPVVALAVDMLILGLVDESPKKVAVGYAHASLIAAVLTVLAFQLPAPGARPAFALIGACLAWASAPLMARAWAATGWARRMVRHTEEQNARVREAMRRQGSDLVVRVQAVEAADVVLVALGQSEQTLRAPIELLGERRWIDPGDHFLVEAAVIGDKQGLDGYRGVDSAHRLQATGGTTRLGRTTEPIGSESYTSEIRAGVIALIAYHVLLFGASAVLTALSI